MSSSRKRRFAQKLRNRRNIEQQIIMMNAWNNQLMKTVYCLMLYPSYDVQKLLIYRNTNEQRNS